MAKIYGDLQGLKANHIKQLEKLQEQRQPGDRFLTPELAEQLADLSAAIHHPISCYINRRGQFVRVAVGTPAQTQLREEALPRKSGDRLSGIRCIVAQARPYDSGDLVAMVQQRLDALVVLALENGGRNNPNAGTIQDVFLAHLAPDLEQPWMVESFSLDDLTDQDADDLIHSWERELQDAGIDLNQLHPSEADHDRVLIVAVETDDLADRAFDDSVAELERLVDSADAEVVGMVQQKRSQPHPKTVVGQGKLDEIRAEAQRVGANLIVFNQDISPSQARNLEDEIGLRVVDRTEVILDIFAQRARSQAGKLQVELAQLEYRLPRLRGQGRTMSRLGAGIGTRGPGETRLETERRTIQRRIAQLQQDVNQLQAHRARLRHQREQQEIPTFALVGYTNAGKSTLLNVLTHAEVYTADQLFATLDPTTRRLTIADPEAQTRRDILLTDTVGFIHHLPPALMDAFRATLEEVSEAYALVHVVDLSHPAWERHIQSVAEVLSELPDIPPRELLVFNKVDRTSSEALARAQALHPDAVFISATHRLGLNTLQQRLFEWVESVPIASQADG
ncbi:MULTISPECIES: GTPase HflX [unclassified Leptolyngbya]|uniref:GTPase HflX n=1 Tax=unclassified Leptolyngbya TaxID=2650499 RepID=UPI0016886CD0|nr:MULTISPECIES: GTPase HflX [unclassified Leptolyngbya]MBD1912103.1 GTPase HflX [Leptolyngbya sp. FACHB-8]MBD2154994.1 GTPase HflX [Leptolyngbya sp. FACHB-16]